MTDFDKAVRRAPIRPPLKRPDPASHLGRHGAHWIILCAAFVGSGLIWAAIR